MFKMPLQLAVATFLSYLAGVTVSVGFTGEPPLLAALWAAISALVVPQDTWKGTLDAVRIRIVGSFIGSVGAVICFMLMPVKAWSVALAIIVVTMLCVVFKYERHMRLACITLMLLLLVHELSPSQPISSFALWRFFDSLLGSLIALGIVRISTRRTLEN